MAIRKLRQKMKPVIWVITIAMFLGMIVGGLTSMKSNSSQGVTAFELNGTKVDATQVERAINNTVNGYSQYLGNTVDREVLSVIAFGSVIEKQLTQDIAKKLKVKVSRSVVNAELKQIRASVQDKQQFSRMLQAQGYNVTTLKEEIKESMTIQLVIDSLKDNAVITEEEINFEFEEQAYGAYYGKEFEEVREEISKTLKEQSGMEEYVRLLEAEKRAMELKNVSNSYADYAERTVLELDGFEFTNLDMAGRVLRNLFATQGDNEAAEIMATVSLEQEVKLANKALDMGIEANEEMPVDSQLFYLRAALADEIKEDYKINETELNKFFEEKKSSYDVEATIDVKLAMYNIETTEADMAAAKARAEKVLAEVTPSNFGDMAVKHSDGPTGPNGGDLGWFGKGQMVPSFEEAVFNTEAGKVHSNVVESPFGYHVIYTEEKTEEEVKARHILFTPHASKETIAMIKEEATNASERVKSSEITFEELASSENVKMVETFEGITKAGYLPEIGYKDELVKVMFATNLDKVSVIEAEEEVFIFEKIGLVEAKEAVLSEMREKVEYDFVTEKVQDEFTKILEAETK